MIESSTVHFLDLLCEAHRANPQPPHRMPPREQGESDGWNARPARIYRLAAEAVPYKQGYAYGLECRARLADVAMAKHRDDSLRTTAPREWWARQQAGGGMGIACHRSTKGGA